MLSFQNRWSETAYFHRWYANKDADTRNSIKSLVRAGRLEFILGGWTSVAPEVAHFEDLITTYEQSQRWLLEEFGYRCVVAFVAPRAFMTKQVASLLRDGGIEMIVIDGVSPNQYQLLQNNQGVEFLWETDPYREEESRIFTHIINDRSSIWKVVQRIMNK